MYNYVLAIHIIFVVCYMAGLFYIVRLFIYHTEAQDKPEPDRTILSKQFEVMESKLWWIITIPSVCLVVASAVTMLCLSPGWLQMPWLHVKLCFVVGLAIYQHICQNKMKEMRNGIFKWTSTQLRIWNEVATIFLFAIVFLAVLKNAVNWIFGVIGIVLLSVILMMAVKLYKRIREKK
ncbi:CopD family protein [Mucilaginibacter myungsuensis]|uniref:Protoporphyrinogen IX oxidase n=1 Tax=Mucilaginibacter myungsuensis TaxID=649104 RepID=A0A929KVT0_9SPHI|nr:CopD family protein [Mucilaginibacter myungsuensis]MBE9662516.1 CopD family protein [Mucilaginibacter myungsuensis]MDN3597935.1 CopD family protein [Mucilaginibacter myungsuensis]